MRAVIPQDASTVGPRLPDAPGLPWVYPRSAHGSPPASRRPTHLQDLRVVIHLAAAAALAGRDGALGEVAALVQQEHGLSVLVLQPLQLGTVLAVHGCLCRQDEVTPGPADRDRDQDQDQDGGGTDQHTEEVGTGEPNIT